jgi:hypothetical protein
MNYVAGYFIGLFVGAVCGALTGALVLGALSALVAEPDAFFHTRTAVILLGLTLGAVWGVIPGAVIGQFIGLTRCGTLNGALAGACVGACLAAYIFATGGFGDNLLSISALASIPGGALAGALTARCAVYLLKFFPR